MLWQRCWLTALLLLVPAGLANAEDEPPAAEAPAEEAPADEAAIAPFTGDVNDPAAVREYAGAQFGKIVGNLQANPDLAEKQAAALTAIVAEWKVENANSQQLVKQITATLAMVSERAALARVTIDELKKKLDEAPDAKTVELYTAKLVQNLSALADSDVAAAEKQLAEARDYLKALAEKSTDDDMKQAIDRTQRPLDGIERSIASEKRLAELIGKDAPPLTVAAWVNGGPLTPEDLKGKVVLLDFWAVWCGPCIMTFPHLREWYEEYHDKGLEIVGVTGYYNFKWDDAAGKAVRGEGQVSHEDEQAMLAKFAEHHKLAHPFAISEDGELAKFYAVTGIPHVALIDRTGKIRLIKVGAGDATAKEIGAKLAELLAE
jgi:thiol-disulfide isomerase/thioredoxin